MERRINTNGNQSVCVIFFSSPECISLSAQLTAEQQAATIDEEERHHQSEPDRESEERGGGRLPARV